jgi:hypothetical protein
VLIRLTGFGDVELPLLLASFGCLERSLYDCISERVSVSRAAVIVGEVDMRRGEFAGLMAELMLNDLQLCLERGDVRL